MNRDLRAGARLPAEVSAILKRDADAASVATPRCHSVSRPFLFPTYFIFIKGSLFIRGLLLMHYAGSDSFLLLFFYDPIVLEYGRVNRVIF